jgi:elongation factor 1-alpha
MTEETPKQHISVCVCGHVDAGKSSLTGRLLYDLKGINDREMAKLREEAVRLGKKGFEFAFYLDNCKDERERGITISCNTKEFYTDRYHYTIIDAPGHRDFVKNMVGGSSQADVALLLCPADGDSFLAAIAKGDHATNEVPGQTRQHALLLNLLGVKQLIVGINKLDAVNYSEEKFNEVANEMRNILKQTGWKPALDKGEIPIIPTAGFHGENILKKSEKMDWWKGLDVKVSTTGETVHVNCLLDALNNMVNLPPRKIDAPLRAPVSGIYKIPGVGDVIASRIEQGEIFPNDQVVAIPTNTTSNPCGGKVFSVQMHHKDYPKAGPGDNVGLNIKGLEKRHMPKKGDILVKKSDTSLKQCATFTAQVQVLDIPGEMKVGYTPICCVRTSQNSVRLEKINWKKGKKTGGQKLEDPSHIESNEMAEVVFKPSKPMVVESFDKCEGLARIAILEGNSVCMIGKCTAVEFVEETTTKKK